MREGGEEEDQRGYKAPFILRVLIFYVRIKRLDFFRVGYIS